MALYDWWIQTVLVAKRMQWKQATRSWRRAPLAPATRPPPSRCNRQPCPKNPWPTFYTSKCSRCFYCNHFPWNKTVSFVSYRCLILLTKEISALRPFLLSEWLADRTWLIWTCLYTARRGKPKYSFSFEYESQHNIPVTAYNLDLLEIVSWWSVGLAHRLCRTNRAGLLGVRQVHGSRS